MEISSERQKDFLLIPETSCWTTESLLPHGFCPNTSPEPAHIRHEMTRWTTDEAVQPWRRNRLAMIRARLPAEPPGLIIDYGTYFGETASIIKDQYPEARVVAMDTHQAFADAALEYDPRLETAVTPPGQLVYAPESVDLVVMADVAEHVYENEWLEILTGALRVLRPGGMLLNHCPVADPFVGEPIQVVIIKFMIGLHHPSVKSVDYLRATTKAAGFTEVEAYACPENHSWGVSIGRKA